MDVDRWRKAGYVPTSDVARIFDVNPTTVYRWIDDGKITGASSGWFRFVLAKSLIKYVRKQYSDEKIAAELVAKIEEALKCGS